VRYRIERIGQYDFRRFPGLQFGPYQGRQLLPGFSPARGSPIEIVVYPAIEVLLMMNEIPYGSGMIFHVF